MRIIAGEFRGRKLLGPESEITRPVTDRVKQSLFDILTPNLPDAVVYDCFAGTGSMGLECLSRGARHVTFFEADRSAANRLRRNIDTIGMKDRTLVIGGDLFKWFGSNKNGRADLIFLDPPYRFLTDQPESLKKLAVHFGSHMKHETLIVFRHDSGDSLALPPLQITDLRTYGSMALEFLQLPTTTSPQSTTDI